MSGLPEGYELRPLGPGDAAGLAAAYTRNREHLAPWEPLRHESFYTVAAQAATLRDQLFGVQVGRMLALVVEYDGGIVGRVNVNNVVRGVWHSGNLGYWIDAEHTGRGVASAAVGDTLDLARHAGMHRLEAGTVLHNTASQAVLQRCGFTEIGVAERYLYIAGEWADHLLFQRILHHDAPE